MERIDPYNIKEKYLRWKKNALENGIRGMTKANSDIILQYLTDMEQGINVASSNKKGSRSFVRLNSIITRMPYLARMFEKLFDLQNILLINERQVCSFFTDMRNGIIKRNDGKRFKSVSDYVKDFKAFWHWHQKASKKAGKIIEDITVDLDASDEKPDWVYLTEEQIKQLCNEAKYHYKVLIWFLFDTGIRAPTELSNIKVSDFYNDFKELNIRDEVSKTFGRRIKLMICSDVIREYVKNKGLEFNDFLFKVSPGSINRYLQALAKKILGDKVSPAGQKYSELTMYDFRHCSCCYWLPRYKSESALKYRFGWKGSDKIHYYSELLGMRDTISQEDMLMDITKTELEKRIIQSDKEKEILQERIKVLEDGMKEIRELAKYAKEKNSNIFNSIPTVYYHERGEVNASGN